MKIAIGVNVAGLNPFVTPYEVLRDVDGFPMDSFSSEAVSAIEYITAAWGGSVIIIACFGLLTLVKYRALIPVAIFMLFVEQSWRQVTSILDRLASNADIPLAAGTLINMGFSAALLIAFILSVIPRKHSISHVRNREK